MWKLEHYEDSACYQRIRLIDSEGACVADSESYYPKALEEHHAIAICHAMNLLEELAQCDNDALSLAYFKGSARAILNNLKG